VVYRKSLPELVQEQLGTAGAGVYLVDYTMPIEPLREEFKRLLAESNLWDDQLATVQVTDASDQAMQVRFLMSASDSTRNWDLRCKVREGLIAFIRDHYPAQLPRVRARLVDGSES